MICDPLLGALFTPPRPELGRYEVCTTSAGLESAAADTGTGGQDVRIEALEALEAFGAAGPYNRAALARLYGGTRVRVVRRWQQRGNEFISETLLSPYPDATLTRLNSGTMVIRFTLDRVQREPLRPPAKPKLAPSRGRATAGKPLSNERRLGAYNSSIR